MPHLRFDFPTPVSKWVAPHNLGRDVLTYLYDADGNTLVAWTPLLDGFEIGPITINHGTHVEVDWGDNEVAGTLVVVG